MRSDRLAWPLFLLLLTVLVPSVGVVWMMREAVRNERLATSQRLREAYQTQLESARQLLQERWAAQLEQAAQLVDEERPVRSFGQIASRGVLDGALVCDRQGRVVCPNGPAPTAPAPIETNDAWDNARRLEFVERRHAEAADAYAQIVRDAAPQAERARARQSQVRCLLAMGDKSSAISVLEEQFNQQGVVDEQGRSLAAAAGLRLLELHEPDSRGWDQTADRLVQLVTDYQGNPLVSTQRRFLMTEMQRWPSLQSRTPTLAFESLSAEALAAGREGRQDGRRASTSLGQSPLDGVWRQSSDDGRLIGLFRTATVRARLLVMVEGVRLPSGVAFAAYTPDEIEPSVVDASLGEGLGQWRLGLEVAAGDPFAASSQQRRAVHVWIAVLVVALTVVLAWLLVAALRQRLQLAQLKNDLVATVSHELKTPLASIRLLVDTLLESDARATDGQSHVQSREYLELIAQENARLTRLIDNFLTFSRMERGIMPRPGLCRVVVSRTGIVNI